MALQVGQLFALFSIDTSGVTTSLNGISSHLISLGNEFTQAGLLWSQAITKPLVNAGKDIIETGMEFHEAMARVAATAGLDLDTEEGQAALNALEKKAKQVAATSIYTSSEVAQAYNYMAMAGWKTGSMLGGIEPIMNLAAASGEDVATVSDIVTDAMTAFGYTFESVGGDVDAFNELVSHFSDVLAAAATNSNTNVSMLGETFKYASSLAGSLGYSIDDMAVAFGLMANRGIKASQAGTAWRRVIANIIDPSSKAQEALDDLNISLYDDNGMLDFMGFMEQLREKFSSLPENDAAEAIEAIESAMEEFAKSDAVKDYEAAIEALDISNIANYSGNPDDYIDSSILEAYSRACDELSASLGEMSESAGEVPEAFRLLQYASKLAGARGLPALLAIISASDEEFTSLTEAIYGSDGAAQKMKETALDSLSGDIVIFKSAVDVLKISIEDLVDESLRDLIQSATELINKFIDMDDESKTTILKMAGIAAAIGPALVGIGTLLKLLPALGSAFSFIASPIGLVAVALGALAVSALDSEGQLGKTLKDMGDMFGLDIDLSEFDISDMLDSVLGSIGNLADNEAVQGFMQRLGEGFVGAMSYIGDLVGDLIGYLLSPEGIEALWNAGLAIGKLLLNSIGHILLGLTNLIDNIVLGILDGLGLVDKEALREETGLATSLTSIIETATEDVENVAELSGESILSAILLGIGSGDSEESLNLIEKMGIRDLWDAFMELENYNPEGKSIKENLISAIFGLNENGQYDQIWNFVNSLSDDIWDMLQNGVESNMNFGEGRDMLQYIIENWFTDMFTGSDTASNEIDEAVAEALEMGDSARAERAMQDMFEDVPESAMDAMETALTDGKTDVEVAAAEVSDAAVQSFLLTMSAENGTLIAESYLGGITDGFTGIEDTVSETTTAAAQTFVDLFASVLSPAAGWSIGAAFANAIASAVSGIVYQLQGILGGLTSQLSSVRMTAAGVSSTLAYSPYGGAAGRATSTSFNQGATAEEIGSAVKGAVSGMEVVMDKTVVGRIITPEVSQNIADNITTRWL